jgi:predicted Zn finger-like uncharacterized protein
MNVTCPQCSTIYRVDPEKVPAGGVNARCASCPGVFRVEPSRSADVPEESTQTPTREASPERSEAPPSTDARSASETAPAGGGWGSAAPQQPAAVGDPPVRSPALDASPARDANPPVEGEPAPPATASGRSASPFGSADPKARAKRLARALVSDIVVYHPERRDRSRREGTLRQEFREEIRKSWEEYVAQVGDGFAKETPFFRDALNEILAGGERVF